MRAQQAHRLAGLDDERLVLLHGRQSLHDRLVCWPVAGRAPQRRIDDEVRRILTDREHVFQKAQQTFLPPALGAQLWAARNRKIGVPWIR